jgi:hypothetical protein
MNKKKSMASKMKDGIHRVGSNPSRFVWRDKKSGLDLYETWKGGKQKITPTMKSMGGNRGEDYNLRDVRKQFNKVAHEEAMLNTMKFRAGMK